MTASIPDAKSRDLMRKVIEFFETRGNDQLQRDYYAHEWYGEFLDFVRSEQVFATISHAGRLRRRRFALGYVAYL